MGLFNEKDRQNGPVLHRRSRFFQNPIGPSATGEAIPKIPDWVFSELSLSLLLESLKKSGISG